MFGLDQGTQEAVTYAAIAVAILLGLYYARRP